MKHILNLIAVALVSSALGLSAGAGAHVLAGDYDTPVVTTANVQVVSKSEPVDIPIWVTRPCKEEDSVNCRWIATGPHAQGNGYGHTLVTRRLPGTNLVCRFYAQRKFARKHDHCSKEK